MISHSVASLTQKINYLYEHGYDINQIKEIVKKEMGNYYNSSHLCFTIEDSIDIIYFKLEEDWKNAYKQFKKETNL